MQVAIIGNGLVSQRHKIAWDKLGISWSVIDKGDPWPKADVYDICTPIYLHTNHIKKAVKLGKVICEKPLAPSVKEAKEVIEWLKDYPDICIIYQFRFNPVFLQLKKEIEEGKYGDIKLITVTYFRYKGGDYFKGWRKSKTEAGGGVLLNVTIHYLDLLQYLFGYPTEIKGMTANLKPMDVEDIAIGILRFPQGAVASITLCSDVKEQKHMEMSVYGTKGSQTIQMRENEYHANNFQAFLNGENFVTPTEALKSLMIVEKMYEN